MGLPSQDRSGELGRSYVYKNKGLAKGPAPIILMAVAGVAVVVGGIWLFSKFKGEGGIAEPKSALADTPKSIASPAKPTTTPVEPKREPTTIQQGAPSLSNSAMLAQAAQPGATPTGTPATTPSQSPSTTPPSGTPSGAPGPSSPNTTPSASPNTAPPSTLNPAGETGKPGPVDVSRPNPNQATPSAPGGTGPNPGSTPAGTPSGAPGSPNVGTPGNPGSGPAITGGGLPPSGSTDEVQSLIADAERKMQSNDLLAARAIFSKALLHRNIVKADAERVRSKLTTINDELVFSGKITPGDKIVEQYAVQSGDNLTKIAKKRELVTDWRLIQRINKVDPSRLSVGQKLKLVRGPFHAVVHKGDYRLDLYQGAPDDQDSWTFIKSFKVGLGTNNGTPVGNFIVKKNSKLINPPWVNPQTGAKFGADDPKNPIGERWIGIEGVGESKIYTGFGIHGTIEPDSIGQQRSMGCVRLGKEDVELIYEMLVEQASVVKIMP